MGHLTASKAQGDLHLVALFQESHYIPNLHLIIIVISAGAKLYFLNLYNLLLQSCIVGTLLFLILELTVIHQLANRRIGLRRNFY